MREEFYKKVPDRTYAVQQYGHEIRVRVGEDLDTTGAIAMSKEAMEELGIKEGNLVDIYGAWMQTAKAVTSNEKDITLVKMNRDIREALPCSINQCVGIRKKYLDS